MLDLSGDKVTEFHLNVASFIRATFQHLPLDRVFIAKLRPIEAESFNILKRKTYLCTTSFNIQKFCVLPTQCIYMFCVDLRTNSDYFSIQR